jgi:hypothetical protein
MAYRFTSGYLPPSQAQFDRAMDDYERVAALLGDDPNAIADHMGWTRGTGCVLKRMAAERRGVA